MVRLRPPSHKPGAPRGLISASHATTRLPRAKAALSGDLLRHEDLRLPGRDVGEILSANACVVVPPMEVAMCLHPEPIGEIPPETVRVARAAFPKGTVVTQLDTSKNPSNAASAGR